MAARIPHLDRSRQSTSIDGGDEALANDVARALALLRTAVQECGWTLEALSAEMRRDKSIISRVLNGERPLTLAFLVALPNDVESLYESKRAEHFGRIVVAPVSREQALKNLVSGLIGVMSAPELPAHSSGQVKAELPIERKKQTA